MSKFSNVKKWPKSVEKLENGGRLSPLRQDLPPQKKTIRWIRPCWASPHILSWGSGYHKKEFETKRASFSEISQIPRYYNGGSFPDMRGPF